VPTEDELRARYRERLAAYKVPVRVVLVEELPRNATGKVLKAPLRRSAAHS
jgi:fatty-acyl-CoA synthase